MRVRVSPEFVLPPLKTRSWECHAHMLVVPVVVMIISDCLTFPDIVIVALSGRDAPGITVGGAGLRGES